MHGGKIRRRVRRLNCLLAMPEAVITKHSKLFKNTQVYVDGTPSILPLMVTQINYIEDNQELFATFEGHMTGEQALGMVANMRRLVEARKGS